MSRPPQVHLQTALQNIELSLKNRRVRMPYSFAVDIAKDLEDATVQADRLAKFAELSVQAFDALEGLLANWPTTEAATLYEPQGGETVLMKDEALKGAAAALKQYRERQCDFVW